MISLSYEALFILISMCCAASFLLGKEIQKAKR